MKGIVIGKSEKRDIPDVDRIVKTVSEHPEKIIWSTSRMEDTTLQGWTVKSSQYLASILTARMVTVNLKWIGQVVCPTTVSAG